jgi:hypothetical protein
MPGETEDRLDSWKKIASYLKRDVTTVQRWERREAMPVHRHLHDKMGSVFAFRSELDEWWESRRRRLTQYGAGEGERPTPTSKTAEERVPTLRAANRSQQRRALPASRAVDSNSLSHPKNMGMLGDKSSGR